MIKFLYQLIKRQAKRENLFSINVNVCRCCVFGQQLLINIQDLWWIHSANMQEISNQIHCEITEKKTVRHCVWSKISSGIPVVWFQDAFVVLLRYLLKWFPIKLFFWFQRKLSAKRVKKKCWQGRAKHKTMLRNLLFISLF